MNMSRANSISSSIHSGIRYFLNLNIFKITYIIIITFFKNFFRLFYDVFGEDNYLAGLYVQKIIKGIPDSVFHGLLPYFIKIYVHVFCAI